MDWLEFVQKSEWPLVVGGALLLFRKPISDLLRDMRPKKLKGFGIDAEFETSLQKAEVLIAEVKPIDADAPSMGSIAGPPDDAPSIAIDKELPSVAEEPAASVEPSPPAISASHLQPQTRILRAYSVLDMRMRSYFRAMKPRLSGISSKEHIGLVGRLIGFDDDEVSALLELRKLRDVLIHDRAYPVSEMEAVRFEMVAMKLGLRASQLYRASAEFRGRAASIEGQGSDQH